MVVCRWCHRVIIWWETWFHRFVWVNLLLKFHQSAVFFLNSVHPAYQITIQHQILGCMVSRKVPPQTQSNLLLGSTPFLVAQQCHLKNQGTSGLKFSSFRSTMRSFCMACQWFAMNIHPLLNIKETRKRDSHHKPCESTSKLGKT